MIRNFSILFSFNFTHTFFRNGGIVDFEMTPTFECQRALKNHNLLFRKMGGKYVVLFQKNGIAGVVSRKIDTQTRFTFLLNLKNPYWQNFTDLGNNSKNSPVGRQIFYFNNIDETTSGIDAEMGPDGKMALTLDQATSWDDTLFLTPSKINLPLSTTMFDKVFARKIDSLIFEEIPKNPENQSNVVLDLSSKKEGAYTVRVAHQNDVTQNVELDLYISRNLTMAAKFGLVEIFQNTALDYSFEKQYFIEFERKILRRKYFVINSSARPITVNLGIPNLNISHAGINFTFKTHGEIIAENIGYQTVIDSFMNNGQDVYIFQSDFSIPLFEKDIPEIKLELAGNILIHNLPGSNISSPKPNDLFIHI